MVIRRIRAQVATHNWFAVAIDVAIVVVGVFLATQANNWNEARLDRERAASYRARLIADLRDNERGMQVSAAYYNDVRWHALIALRGFDRPVDELGIEFLNSAYQTTQVLPRIAKHPTYDEILTAGNAELMGSIALRERLANFYYRMDGLNTLLTTIPAYRERLRSTMPYDVQQAIRAKCDEILTTDDKGRVTARLPLTCPLAIDPAVIRNAVAAVRAAPTLKNDVTGALVDIDGKLVQYAKLQRHAREMRTFMERERRP